MHWVLYALLGLLALVIGVFALIGVLYVTRGTPVRRVRAPGDDDGPPEARDARFQATVELLTTLQGLLGDVRSTRAVGPRP